MKKLKLAIVMLLTCICAACCAFALAACGGSGNSGNNNTDVTDTSGGTTDKDKPADNNGIGGSTDDTTNNGIGGTSDDGTTNNGSGDTFDDKTNINGSDTTDDKKDDASNGSTGGSENNDNTDNKVDVGNSGTTDDNKVDVGNGGTTDDKKDEVGNGGTTDDNKVGNGSTSGSEQVTEKHSLTLVAAKSATCTTAGNEAYYTCSHCDKWFEDEAATTEITDKTSVTIAALNHDLQSHEAKTATCTEVGWTAYVTCSRCDYTTYEEVAALGHNESAPVTENEVAATCTKDGSYDTVIYCSACKEELSRETKVVKALDHDLVEHERKEATCTEKGWKAYNTCSRGDYTTYEEIAALGHKESAAVTENETKATCTENGSYDTVIYCSVCKEELSRKTNVVKALDHDLQSHEGKEATCTEKGWKAYNTCSRCDYTTYEEIAALGHNESAAVTENEVAATCTKDGSYDTVVYCSVCKEELSRETNVVKALDHDLVDHEGKEATCTEKGWKAYNTCSRGDYTTFEEIPILPHDFVDRICSNCGYKKISTKGLNYVLSYNKTYYIVKGIGTATDTDIVIANSYNDLPVSEIASNAFKNCTNITSIDIPSSVTLIGASAFSGCSSLESVTLPFVGGSIKTSNDTYQYPLGYIFGNISYNGGVATTQYYYGNSTSSTTYSTYYIPSSLKKVVITGGNILYGAFFNCSRLTSVIIGNSVTSIGVWTFYDCSSLTSITIPDSVTEIGSDAFHGCSNLQYIEYNNAYYLGNDSNQYVVLVKAENASIISCTISSETKLIYNSAFSGCSSLTSVTIGEGVTGIGEFAFYNCSSLTSIIIPDGVTSIGSYAFYNCNSLTSITIPDSVTSIGNRAFFGCSGLKSITIPNSVTSIGAYIFSSCNSLTSITLPFVGDSIKTSSDTNQYPFGYIFSTSSYTGGKPTRQYYHGNSTTSITYSTYYIPSSLKSVTITGGNILYGAFYNCDNLTNITIGDGVTYIGPSAFCNCNRLESITIPDSVTSIGLDAFYNCNKLTNVYYVGTSTEWQNISIGSDNEYLTSATRYYYSETQPTEEGNWWHYDEDGVTPVVWTKEN